MDRCQRCACERGGAEPWRGSAAIISATARHRPVSSREARAPCASGWWGNCRPSIPARPAATPPRPIRFGVMKRLRARQQTELERVQDQAKRQGCDSSGFFSLFSGQSAQCGPINTRIQQMRSNLDQITSNLAQLRGGGFGGSGTRQSTPLGADGARAEQLRPAICRHAPQQRRRRFSGKLFGGNNTTAAHRSTTVPHPAPIARSAREAATASTSRSRSPLCQAASRMTSASARAFAREQTRRCSPTAIPARI